MSIYHDLLQEQINILKEKGYQEKSIDSPDKEGWLFTQLQRSFSDAMHQSLQEGASISFQVSTTGFFNSNKDIVQFQFGYEFNIDSYRIDMKEITLKSDQLIKRIVVHSTKDIPHSSQALALITAELSKHWKRMKQPTPVRDCKSYKRIR